MQSGKKRIDTEGMTCSSSETGSSNPQKLGKASKTHLLSEKVTCFDWPRPFHAGMYLRWAAYSQKNEGDLNQTKLNKQV